MGFDVKLIETITIAAAAIINCDNQMLLVRKRGTKAFMQPGGKIDTGETAVEALVRELKEELGFQVDGSQLNFVGKFQEVAANEPNSVVIADVFKIQHDGIFEPQAEIEEICWYPSDLSDAAILAPLTKNKIIPASGV